MVQTGKEDVENPPQRLQRTSRVTKDVRLEAVQVINYWLHQEDD